jgi:hypothetical protein
LRERFKRAVFEGDLPSDVNAAGVARYIAAVAYGLALQAAGGTSAADLEAVAAIAILSLPG